MTPLHITSSSEPKVRMNAVVTFILDVFVFMSRISIRKKLGSRLPAGSEAAKGLLGVHIGRREKYFTNMIVPQSDGPFLTLTDGIW